MTRYVLSEAQQGALLYARLSRTSDNFYCEDIGITTLEALERKGLVQSSFSRYRFWLTEKGEKMRDKLWGKNLD